METNEWKHVFYPFWTYFELKFFANGGQSLYQAHFIHNNTCGLKSAVLLLTLYEKADICSTYENQQCV